MLGFLFLGVILAILGLIDSIFCSLFVVLDNLSKYFNLTIFDFVLLNLYLLQFKLILKRLNVLVELILKRLEFIFKFLEVAVERKEHVVEVLNHSVDLNFHIRTQ
jgi:hypothetical protein